MPKQQQQGLTYRQIFKTLGASIREFKGSSIASPLFVLGEVVIECLIPFQTASLIDKISLGGGFQDIAPYAVTLVLMALVSRLLRHHGGRLLRKASTGFARNLRHGIFAQISASRSATSTASARAPLVHEAHDRRQQR